MSIRGARENEAGACRRPNADMIWSATARMTTPSRRLARIVAAGLVAAATGCLPASAQTPPVLPLADAVQLALAQNRDLQQAQAEVEKATSQAALARAQRLPRFNVGLIQPNFLSEVDLRLGPVNLGLPRAFAFAFGTVTQPISQLYDIGLGMKAAALGQTVAAERVRGARQAVVNELTRGYYACVRAQTGLVVAREAVTLSREIERLLRTLVDERVALDADLLEAQARLARQEHDLLVLENALTSGRERINVALARDPDTAFSFEAIPTTVPADVEVAAVRDRMLDQRPDIRQARLSVQLADVDIRAKKAERLPRVGATFAYVGNINMSLLPGNLTSAVLQASWEPWDWGRRSREVAVKSLTARQADTAVRQLEASAVVDLGVKARSLREARSLVTVTELAGRAARERLRVVLDRNTEGAVLAKDLLLAQVGLAEADFNYQAALLAYWEARADYEKVAGEDPR